MVTSMPTPAFSPPSHPLPLPKQGLWPESSHRFDDRSVWAIRAALVSGRPLLIRGEAGIGKTQLARAAAAVLKVPLLHHVVDERTERDDLLYQSDAVARLAVAQIAAIVEKSEPGKVQEKLHERNFIRPAIFWWALDWNGAARQADRYSENCRLCKPPCETQPNPEAPCSCVMLIDEIDKADPSVPNGLLECLGSDGFRTPLIDEGVHIPVGGKPPLVMLTTNEERELPLAFLRRCLVLTISFPKQDAAARKFLIDDRARVRFPDECDISSEVCQQAATQLLSERQQADRNRHEGLSKPGAAEFLDLIRVLVELGRDVDPKHRTAKQLECLAQVSRFVLRKRRDEEADE
jgi:MoxR-like ATPase